MSWPKQTDEERLRRIHVCLATFAEGRGIPLAEVIEEWNERAAIHEYVGGVKLRRNAELYAIRDTFQSFTWRRGLGPAR